MSIYIAHRRKKRL